MFALGFVEGMKGKQGTPSGITADVVTSSLRAGAGAEGRGPGADGHPPFSLTIHLLRSGAAGRQGV